MPTNGTEDGAVRQQLNLAANSLLDRASLMQSLLGGSRDIDRDCNYPKGVIPKETYQELYDREPIAARVVEVYPKECWQVQPSVYEDEDSETETPFEKVWSELATSIRAEKSYHQDEQGSVLWEYLYRADVLSGIGHYGIILLGIDDGKDLAEPADLVPGSINDEVTMAPEGTPWTPLPGTPEAGPVGESGPRLGKGSTDASAYTKGARTAGFANGKNRTWSWNQSGGNSKKGPKRRLTFLRVFPESMAWIDQFDSNPASPRFGQPVRYTLLFNDPAAQAAGVGLQMITAPVHWTRVIHVADNLASSEVFGVPRMQAVLNRLLDIRKIHGGSAEMYWRGAFPGYSLETLPQLGTEVDIDTEGVKKMMWDWANGLQRHVVLTGLTMKSLSPQVTDPSPQVNTQIEAICIKLGVPIRIFKGSERGELASSQDDAAWNDRLKQRQAGYVTPRLVVPFVDRLIALGVLPAPEGYSVWWPDLTSKSDQEKAAIASQRTTGLVAYGASAPTQDIITPTDYLIKIQGFEEAEAQSIVENGEEAKAKREKEQAKQQADQLKQQQDQAEAEHQRQLELAAARGPQQPPPNEGGNGGGGTDGAPPVGPGGSPGGSSVADVGVQNYDPGQPRDDSGKWSGGGSSGSGDKDPHEHVEIHDSGTGEVFWHGPRHEAEQMLREQEQVEPGHGLKVRPHNPAAAEARQRQEEARRQGHEEGVSEARRQESLRSPHGLLPGHKDYVAPPERLYHATLAADEIKRSGFKSSDELGHATLGGSSSHLVSFTTRENADHYARALDVARQAARGELGHDDLIRVGQEYGVSGQRMRELVARHSHNEGPATTSFGVLQAVSFEGKKFPLFMGTGWGEHLKSAPPASVVSIPSKGLGTIYYNPGEKEWRVGGLKGVTVNYDPDQPREPADTTGSVYNSKVELTGGRWVTVDGVHVYVKGGKIVAGPAALEGHPPSDLKSIHQDAHAQSARAETATHKAETGGSRTDHVEAMQHHADAAHSHALAAQHPDNKVPEESKVLAEAASVKATHHAVEAGHGDDVKHPEEAQAPKVAEPQEKKAEASDKSTQPAKSPEEDYRKNGTRAKSFKEWFGDWEKDAGNASKVVDPHTGEPKETHGEEPKVVYHGRQATFDTFDMSKAKSTEVGLGAYFAEDRRIANSYATMGGKKGDILTAYLSIKKPFNFDTPIATTEVEGWSRVTKEMKGAGPKYFTATVKAYQRRDGNPDGTMPGHVAWNALKDAVGEKEVNRVLEKLGYDGITHTAMNEAGVVRRKASEPNFGKVWVAFQPAQIKAKDNAGTFAKSSANIYNEWMDYSNSLEGSETMNDRTPGFLFPPGNMAVDGELDLGLVSNWDSNWEVVQSLIKNLSEECGASLEEVRRLGGILSSVDITTLRPPPVTINVNGSQPVSLGVTTVLPPVIANYLAYSTARNPLATLRAARDLVGGTASKVVGRRHSASELVAQELRPTTIFDPDLGPVLNVTDGERAEMVSGLHDTLKEHGYSDWYIALLAAATEETGSLDAALPLANDVFNEQQEDPENEPQEDDASMALGLPFDLVHNFGPGYDTYLTTNAVSSPGAANPWGPYVGPRGGRGWKNANTGRIVYGGKQPGLGRGHTPVVPGVVGPGTATPPTGTAPGQPKAQRTDPATVKAHIAKLLTNPSQITAAHIKDVKEQLLSMTVAQIHGVRKDLGLKASGLKADLAAKVSQRALAGLGKAQSQTPATALPPHQPPTPAQHPTSPVAPAQHQPPKLDVKDPVAVRAAVDSFITGKNWSGGAAGILKALVHGNDTPLEKIGAHLASLTGVPHHIGFDLAHTAVKELVAGLPTHSPKASTPPAALPQHQPPAPPAPTPVHPTGTGTPSPLHRGSNVITGAPAPPHLPTVPHKDEIEWSTGKAQPGTLNGVDFAPAPHHFWEHVKDKDIGEPPPTRPIQRAGVMVQEPDGRIWIVKPTNEFGDRKYTMPGGGVEHGLTHQQNAMKEVWEETGLQVEITGHLGDFRDSNNKNIGRLYIGKRVGGAPWDAKIEPHIIDDKTGKPSAESSHVVLVTPERAGKLLHRTDDLAQLMTVAPPPVGTATRGRGSQALVKFVEAIQPAKEDFLSKGKAAGTSKPGNGELHAVQEIRGFNGEPKVVSKKEMDTLLAGGDHIEMLRGLSAHGTISASDLAKQFREGDHYPGFGCFGSGTYADSTKGYSNAASSYAGYGSGDSAMLRIALPKTAKIIKQSELEKKVPINPEDFKGYENTQGSYTAREEWHGVHAALAGYDAIEVDGKSSHHYSYGKGYYVILNRSVLTVQKEDSKGHMIS